MKYLDVLRQTPPSVAGALFFVRECVQQVQGQGTVLTTYRNRVAGEPDLPVNPRRSFVHCLHQTDLNVTDVLVRHAPRIGSDDRRHSCRAICLFPPESELYPDC
jgi:hypothetical protein